MNKIGIFGGSFSPITIGHINIANYVIENNIVDFVYMMPCYKSLYEKQLIDAKHRLKMIDISTKHPNVISFDWEIKNKIENIGTYDVMKMIESDLHGKDLYFIIGLDNSQKVHKWLNGDKIIKELKFIVAPRPEIEIKSDWFMRSPHIWLKDYVPENVSSTLVKQMLLESGDSRYLDRSVLEYIKKNNVLPHGITAITSHFG